VEKWSRGRREGGGQLTRWNWTGGRGGGGSCAQATGPECSRTMGLMHLWSEVRLCRVIHYIGQREVLLYTYLVICCTKDSSSEPFKSRKEDTHFRAMRYARQWRDNTTHDRGQTVSEKSIHRKKNRYTSLL
jgi:hypothetical protein